MDPDQQEVYINWESTVYADGGKFEGLMKDGTCHGYGNFEYADGDRFQGTYADGMMNGFGVYKWNNGSVFKGQWKDNNMHGCGRKYYPGGAVEEGEWVDDDFVGDFTGCNAEQSADAEKEAEIVAERARMFQNFPDGEVNNAKGIFMSQDPMVYGAKSYLIPGPARELYDEKPTQEDEAKMAAAGRLHKEIYDSWNFKLRSREVIEKEMKELLKKDAEAEAARKKKLALQKSGLMAEEDEDEDDEDEDEDEDEPKASGSGAGAPPGAASISLSAMRFQRSFERAARGIATRFKNARQHAMQRNQQNTSSHPPPFACLSMAIPFQK